MSYLVQNNKAYVDGRVGYYDKYIQNPSVRYARNAASNNKTYTDDISSFNTKLPPLEFEYRYMVTPQQGLVDSQALIAASYEEMDANSAIPADKISNEIKEIAAFEQANNTKGDTSLQHLADVSDSRIIDLNNDGVIDLAEYATTILASDMYSKSNELNFANITGVINKTGSNKILDLINIQNANNTRQCLKYIYDAYNLGQAQNQFLLNPNNTIDIRG